MYGFVVVDEISLLEELQYGYIFKKYIAVGNRQAIALRGNRNQNVGLQNCQASIQGQAQAQGQAQIRVRPKLRLRLRLRHRHKLKLLLLSTEFIARNCM